MISISATMKWGPRTQIALQEAPEKVLRAIARQTLDLTGSSKVTAYKTGKTERSMYDKGVQGDFEKGLYIGNFTDYAMYVYPRTNVHWTNPNTKTKWFEHIWTTKGPGIISNAIKECKI